jgi:hypothetical protein
VGEEIVLTKEGFGCRVFQLLLLWLHLLLYCPELWEHQSFGVLCSG